MTARDEVLERLGPLITDDPLDATVTVAACIASVFEDSFDAVRDRPDGQPSWSYICDPAVCPAWALPWLAVFAGINPSEYQEAALRTAIAVPAGHRRGTVAAITSAGRPFLTGTQEILVLERTDPSAPGADREYDITLITRTAETPDAAAFLAALSGPKVKPAGIVLHHVVADGTTWDELTGTWDSLTGSWDTL